MDVVPNLDQTLISGSKFADAGYTKVYDQQEVNFYESNKIKISAKSVLQGYRCPRTELWRVPLQDHIINENTETIILDAKGGKKSLNKIYEVPTSTIIRDHLTESQAQEQETINNFYKLQSLG